MLLGKWSLAVISFRSSMVEFLGSFNWLGNWFQSTVGKLPQSLFLSSPPPSQIWGAVTEWSWNNDCIFEKEKEESSLLLREVQLLQQEGHGIGIWKAVQIGHALYSDAVYGKEDSKAESSRKQKVNFWPQRIWVNEKFSILRGNFLFSLEEVNCSYLSNWVVQSWLGGVKGTFGS